MSRPHFRCPLLHQCWCNFFNRRIVWRSSRPRNGRCECLLRILLRSGDHKRLRPYLFWPVYECDDSNPGYSYQGVCDLHGCYDRCFRGIRISFWTTPSWDIGSCFFRFLRLLRSRCLGKLLLQSLLVSDIFHPCVLISFSSCPFQPRIPFATANMVTATTAIKGNLGVVFFAYLSAAMAIMWSIMWTLALIGILDKTECSVNALGEKVCNQPNYMVLFVFFLAYFFGHQVLQNTVHVICAGAVGTSSFCNANYLPLSPNSTLIVPL
jgi:hypothetical protein